MCLGMVSFSQDSLDVIETEKYLETIEKSLQLHYSEWYTQDETDSIIKSLAYEEKEVPVFSDSVYIARINALNDLSPFEFVPNEAVLKTVKYFSRSRRRFTAIALGRSKMYFPMYEEKLDQNQMPLELKYLSVIESGLRPYVKSRVGACGLWQFMYRTGKMFDLEETNYVDDRMNPVKATDAACKYLKYLHSLYNDWSMALAAYNAGPGNVNKAIRRSGGKMTYWEIRPFLPKETQNYVPIFISMTYMMTYHAEHNIKAEKAKMHRFETDSVCITKPLHITTIDSLLSFSREDFKYLNPEFKTDFIPLFEGKRCLVMPVGIVDTFLLMEDSIYAQDSIIYNTKGIEYEGSKGGSIPKTHKVKKGDKLSELAKKYGISYSTLKLWNGLAHGSDMKVGQILSLRKPKKKPSTTKKPSSSSSSKPKTPTTSGNGKYYTVRKGDNLWAISKKHGTTIDAIKKLNPGLNPQKLQSGQKLRIR
jgi:membrane-bound lytic murein transglycosylase D